MKEFNIKKYTFEQYEHVSYKIAGYGLHYKSLSRYEFEAMKKKLVAVKVYEDDCKEFHPDEDLSYSTFDMREYFTYSELLHVRDIEISYSVQEGLWEERWKQKPNAET